MKNKQTYEKIVACPNKGKHLMKKITVILTYALFFAVFFFISLQGSNPAPVIVVGALSTLMLVLITWKYVCVEYEYGFWYGSMSVAAIYGKKKRRALIETDIRTLLIIAPATEEYISKAEHFSPEKRVIAVSSEKADNIWLVVTGGEDERRVLVFFEADEYSLDILKSINPHVFIKKA